MNYRKIGVSPHRRKKAFTMVEVLLVVMIIGLLFVLLVSNMDFSGTKAKTATAKADLQTMELMLQDMASTDNGFPDSIDLLRIKINKVGLEDVITSVQTDNERKFLDAGRIDPWGQAYRIYLCGAGTDNESVAVLCAGVDGKYMTSDDLGGVVSYKSGGLYAKVDVENVEGKVLHVPGAWEVTVHPDCAANKPGKRVPICELCGMVMHGNEEEIPAAHELITVEGVPPTCTSAGRTNSIVCANCHTVFEANVEIPPIPHSFGNWTKISDGGDGVTLWQRTCSICDMYEVTYTVNGQTP